MKNLENLDSTHTLEEDMIVSGGNTTDHHIRKSLRLHVHPDSQNNTSDKEKGKVDIHNRGNKDTTNDLDILKNKLSDYMKHKTISKKKVKQRLKHQQRQCNRKYGKWDKISTRSMNKYESNNVKINTITQNEQQKREERKDGKDIKSPVLKYNKKLKQLKPTYDKLSMSKALLFFLGSIGTRNSIFNSGAMIPLVPINENYIPGNYQQLPEYNIDF